MHNPIFIKAVLLVKLKHIIWILIFVLIPLLFITIFAYKKEAAQKQAATFTYLGEHLIFDDISFSSDGKQLQEIKLYRDKDFDSYHAYIPALPKDSLHIYFNHCKSVIFDGTELSSGDALPSVEAGIPYLVQALTWTDEVFWEDYITFYFCDTLPSMFVTTESNSMEYINADKTLKESATFATYTCDGKLDTIGYCNIAGRGSSSWSRSQKSYNLNLSDATSILGMDSVARWALLANYSSEFPQIKNKIVFELAERLEIPYTTQSEFVQVYLNGQYNGLYLLTQRVDVGDGSVKINNLDSANQLLNSEEDYHGDFETVANGLSMAGALLANTPDTISGGYLLEFNARYERETSYFTTPQQYVSIKSPRESTYKQVNYIADYVRKAENVLFNPDSTSESYLDYIDMDTWSKVYILQNFFVQWDVEYASFYLYKQADDPLLYAGPVWDFDLSCGKTSFGNYPKLTQHVQWLDDTQGKWLRQLGTYPDFAEYTKEQYCDSFSPALSYFLTHELSDIITPLVPALEMNALRWDKDDMSLDTIKILYDWISERQTFLDTYYANPNNYYKVTFMFPWAYVTYYAEKNTPLNFLPCEQYGHSSENLSIFGYEEIIGWTDENGTQVFAEDIITSDVSYYPIYE